MILVNKLLLNSDDELGNVVIEEDTDVIIRFDNTDRFVNFIVEDNICLNITELCSSSKCKYTFTLGENSRLIYNCAVNNSNNSLDIYLNGEGASLTLNYSCLVTKEGHYNCNIIHNNKNTVSEVFNHGINASNNSLIFDINTIVNKDAVNTNAKQENKIINYFSGKSKILPNLIVNLDDVNASHSAYISDFDKNDIFYMKSRGIKEEEIKKMLIKGFLLGNLEVSEELIDEVKAILNI